MLQTKLKINEPGDRYEQEADRIADQVMRMSEPFVQRQIALEEEGEGMVQRLAIAHQASPSNQTQDPSEVPPIIHDVLNSSGQSLDPVTQVFMEQRFRWDFSQVRVHTDDRAAQSSQAIQALAYTVGRDIVFNMGQYSPHTNRGKRLLAHELTHVVQQSESKVINQISRFADTDHNVIEEVALTLAEIAPDEIKQIHAGNTKRDYSQTGAIANLILLCDQSNYGGYKDVEHFDNFQWNELLQNWQSKGDPTPLGTKNPITHIEAELLNFVDALPDKAAFQHVGSAFHTIEDFFAHSNFVELINEDFRFGKTLVTGGGGSGDTALFRILESVSNEEAAPFYGGKAEQETAKSPPQSHARMAKDYKSNPYYTQAVVLAALVIKEIGTYIKVISTIRSKEERINYVREVIMGRVKRYLHPPNQQDKWWEELREMGGKEMEKAIQEATAKTPVTINQCVLSPLRSIEASKDSNLKLLGIAFPVTTKQGYVWIQVGTGFLAPPAFHGSSGAVEPRSMEFVPLNLQITGRF
ncbi:MAG: DUF4157 domain-containing protein [Phormidesmis sp. CAN_BIN44]|nr:DUF4157 domain-containing protein [Phormidesmis sp. CAN_BIN44]